MFHCCCRSTKRAHKTMLGGKSKKLDFLVEKTLLQLAEKQNVTRDQIVLKDLCDSAHGVLGEPGSGLRRNIQEHWNNIKRRNILSYVSYLKRFQVTPSNITIQLMHEETVKQRAQGAPSSSSSDSSSDSSVAGTPPPSIAKKKSFSSVKKSSTRSKSKSSVGDLSQGLRTLNVASPVPKYNFSPIRSMMASSDWTGGSSFHGSKTNPIVVHVVAPDVDSHRM